MICPRCNVEMEIGFALPDNIYARRAISSFPLTPLNADTIKFIDCFKCPKCGHSDDGIIIRDTCVGIENRNKGE